MVGTVTASDAVIEGELQGHLVVRGRVELRATAKVRADVTARTVAIADGCFFDGRIHMTGSGAPGQPTSFREWRRPWRRRRATTPAAAPSGGRTSHLPTRQPRPDRRALPSGPNRQANPAAFALTSVPKITTSPDPRTAATASYSTVICCNCTGVVAE